MGWAQRRASSPPQPTSPHLVTNEPRAVSVRLLRPLEFLVQLLRLRKRHPADLPAPRVQRACAVSNCFQSEMGDKCISDRAGTLKSYCGRAGLTVSQQLISVPRTDPAYRTPCTLSDVQLRAASAVLAPSVGQTWMQRCTGAVARVWVFVRRRTKRKRYPDRPTGTASRPLTPTHFRAIKMFV